MLNIMSMYHACILYPNLTYALTSTTRESSASLIASKVKEIEDSYPILKNEKEYQLTARENTELGFKSGGIISNLANNRASLGQRRHKLMVEEYAQVDTNLLTSEVGTLTSNSYRITLLNGHSQITNRLIREPKSLNKDRGNTVGL